MRVVVAGWLLGLGPSGANRRLLGLLEALPRHLQPGETITVLHGEMPEDPPAGVSWQPVEIPAVPAWKRALHQQRVLPRLLRELRADVFEQGFLPVVARAPCPVCVTLHDLRDLGPFARRNRWMAAVAHRRSLHRAAAVVAPSRFTADELRNRLGWRRPVDVVPGGVGPEFLECFGPREQQPNDPYFLHVGHLERRKNLDMLLAAYARFAATGDEVPALVLVGADAGEGPRLRAQARQLGIRDRVRFLGRVSDEALMELYSGCRMLLFPSLYEGFGIPALEALALGKPVLVSDVGALPEVVGAAGTVLPASDIEAWARAMAQGVEEDGGPERRAHARTMSWEACAATTLALWRRLADQSVGQVAEGASNG